MGGRRKEGSFDDASQVRVHSADQTAQWGTSPSAPYVITTQPVQQLYPNLGFLRDWNSFALEKKERCGEGLCFGCFYRRRYYVADPQKVYRGFAEAPFVCCLICAGCGFTLNVHIPENQVKMSVYRYPSCCERYCCCFYWCSDEKYSDMMEANGAKIGTFERIPRFCRPEGLCWSDVVIKDQNGQRAFNIKKRPCCEGGCALCSCPCSCPCLYVCSTCICTPSCELKCVPCFVCGPGILKCLLCMEWLSPMKVTSAVDDSHIATIWRQFPSWIRQCFCCEETKYTVDCMRANESSQNKALFMGTALTIDQYNMAEWLQSNDSELHMELAPDY